MQRKLLMTGSVLCLVLALAVSWYGWHSVQRQLLVMQLKNHYDMGQRARRRGRRREAQIYFRMALEAWDQARRMPGFLPVESDGFNGFLTAGNCYQVTRRLTLARHCFEQARHYDPNSVTVLSSLGVCAYLLGDHKLARSLLKESNRICPLKKKLRPLLKKLRAEAGKPEKGAGGS